jgi:hypothetical protein
MEVPAISMHESALCAMDIMCQRGKIKEESLYYDNPKRRRDI